MISEVFKFLFRVIVIGVLIVVVFMGAIAFYFFVIGPYRHMRNTEKAEVFNQEIWENGFAEIYTVSASVEFNQEIYSDSIEIICAPKMETSTITIKGGPSLYDYVLNFSGRQEIVIPFADGYSVRVRGAISCSALARLRAEDGSPSKSNFGFHATIENRSDALGSCSVSLYERAFQLENLRIHQARIVSVRRAPVKEILSREEYGPADRAVARAQELGKPQWFPEIAPANRRFYWNEEKMCWASGWECSELADNICLPEL